MANPTVLNDAPDPAADGAAVTVACGDLAGFVAKASVHHKPIGNAMAVILL